MKLLVCVLSTSLSNRRDEGGAGRGILASWEEVPPHLEFGETMTGRGKSPIAPFAALEGGYAHRLTKDPRDTNIWQNSRLLRPRHGLEITGLQVI